MIRGAVGSLLALLAALLVAPGCAGQAGAPRDEAAESSSPEAGSAAEAAAQQSAQPAAEPAAAPSSGLRRYRLEILETYPHDPEAFTQGLLLEAPGVLLESTGRYGRSELRRVDLASGDVMRRRTLPEDVFGEGLARVPADGGDRLVQLTWLAGRAFVWDAADFEPRGEWTYPGEGWGLCHQPREGRLVLTDGSSRLTFRHPQTFEFLGEVEVTLEGRPLRSLNELECVGGKVWANVLYAPTLYEIDPASGRVVGIADAGSLLSPEEQRSADVLNGIAHDPADGTFLVTGKLWPKLFRVRLVTEER